MLCLFIWFTPIWTNANGTTVNVELYHLNAIRSVLQRIWKHFQLYRLYLTLSYCNHRVGFSWLFSLLWWKVHWKTDICWLTCHYNRMPGLLKATHNWTKVIWTKTNTIWIIWITVIWKNSQIIPQFSYEHLP